MSHELVNRFADERRHRENRGRLAFAFGRFTSEGQGGFEYEDRIEFGCTFIERPFVAYGSIIDTDDARELLAIDSDNDDVKLPLPIATGYVTEWDKTPAGHYTGAWVAVSVLYPIYDPAAVLPYPVSGALKIQHDFTFSAIAIKDIPLND